MKAVLLGFACPRTDALMEALSRSRFSAVECLATTTAMTLDSLAEFAMKCSNPDVVVIMDDIGLSDENCCELLDCNRILRLGIGAEITTIPSDVLGQILAAA